MLELEYKGRKDGVKYTDLLKLVDAKIVLTQPSKPSDVPAGQAIQPAAAATTAKGDLTKTDKAMTARSVQLYRTPIMKNAVPFPSSQPF